MTHETASFGSVVLPPGAPTPLGATWTSEGLNLAVRAPSAELVEACLFLGEEEVRVPLEARSHGVHHGFLPGIEVGTRYGLRAHGPWEPQRGLRFNPAKLLVDPYARAIVGDVTSPDVPRPAAADDPEPPGRARLRPLCASRGGRRRLLRLARRHRSGDTVGRDRRLRDARQGVHRHAPRCPGGICAARTPDSPTPQRSSTCCGSASRPWSCSPCTTRWRSLRSPLAARETTGATAPSASSRLTRRTPRIAHRAPRSTSSGPWCARCTRPVSRSSSTSSTTTPARAASTARR